MDEKVALALLLIVSIILGLVGGITSSFLLTRPGPTGEQGPIGPQGLPGQDGTDGLQGEIGPQGPTGQTGPQGEQGLQGPQGISGTDGINSVLQIIQGMNTTTQNTENFTAMQWINMSDVDASMMITVNVQQNSRLLIQFSATVSLQPPGSLRTRIVLDNNVNSTECTATVGPPSAGNFKFPSHIEFLTGPLTSGSHTIQLQVLRESGSPMILDRTLTVMELTS